MSLEHSRCESRSVAPSWNDTPLATGQEGACTADVQTLTYFGVSKDKICWSLLRLDRFVGSAKSTRKYLFPGGGRCTAVDYHTCKNCVIADSVVLVAWAGMAAPDKEDHILRIEYHHWRIAVVASTLWNVKNSHRITHRAYAATQHSQPCTEVIECTLCST